ncbi:GTPase [Yasminevirus sp. GU-2018]|uniref:GTPase n=1 Tax=Yasminevirus sp. GU-2018 TaxID=2420051 RepID=A0A5K0U7F5_9VIRU|nr:GTPase [Yasminevirus sp. GU-2018]
MTDDVKNLVLDVLYLPAEGKLKPEPDKTGNIEYKLRLDKKDVERRDNMVSQMLWRMNNGRNEFGRYEAHYILGINDDGTFSDISEAVLTTTMNIFRGVVKRANGKIVSDKIYVFPGNKMIIHAVVRKDNQERDVPETKIVITGPTDAGKSSLMGRLTYGQKDDGNGFSRKLVLRHVHEKTTGSTSCQKYDTIGFAGSNIMNYSIGLDFTMENIYNSSDRMINLIDVPGDMKYIKTILYSVSSISPNHIIICIPFKKEVDETAESIDDCGEAEIDLNGSPKKSKTKSGSKSSSKSSSKSPRQTPKTSPKKTKSLSREPSDGSKIESKTMSLHSVLEMYSDVYKFIVSLCLAYNLQPIFVYTKCDLAEGDFESDADLSDYKKEIGGVFNKWRDELMGATVVSGASSSDVVDTVDVSILSSDKKTDTKMSNTVTKKSQESKSQDLWGGSSDADDTGDTVDTGDVSNKKPSDVADYDKVDGREDNSSDIGTDADSVIESTSAISREMYIDFTKCTAVAVSNVTDVGYETLTTVLSKIKIAKHTPVSKDKLFIVNDSFTIPDTGLILHGTLKYGVINAEDSVNVLCHGVVYKKKVKSIHRKTLDVEKLSAGESGSVTFYGKIDKGIDKTSMIVGSSWLKKVVTKARVTSAFPSIKLKPQQYMLFVDNNIVTVLLTPHDSDADSEGEIYTLTCVNSFSFILDTDIGILKDEQQNYYFIRFVE